MKYIFVCFEVLKITSDLLGSIYMRMMERAMGMQPQRNSEQFRMMTYHLPVTAYHQRNSGTMERFVVNPKT